MLEFPLPQHNHLLAQLFDEVQRRIYPQLELLPLLLGHVIYQSGDILRHV
ncbi:hypothetical protein [Vibrio sp. S234-5]|nr:hypothetical protein [Vibrio sp. S234-5]